MSPQRARMIEDMILAGLAQALPPAGHLAKGPDRSSNPLVPSCRAHVQLDTVQRAAVGIS